MSESSQAVTKDILEARKQIDRLDQQIAQLCAERIKIAEFILKNKTKHNISRKDPVREQRVLQNYVKKIKKRHVDVSEKSVQDFVRSLMNLAPNYKTSIIKKRRFYGKTAH